ncbi:hypothetical protein DFJ77DRAFT_275015 [Powellomyces hirtus]|nr:hypothetical protein DFJ77DRAFT_275015 [Powellomyces hirtus]
MANPASSTSVATSTPASPTAPVDQPSQPNVVVTPPADTGATDKAAPADKGASAPTGTAQDQPPPFTAESTPTGKKETTGDQAGDTSATSTVVAPEATESTAAGATTQEQDTLTRKETKTKKRGPIDKASRYLGIVANKLMAMVGKKHEARGTTATAPTTTTETAPTQNVSYLLDSLVGTRSTSGSIYNQSLPIYPRRPRSPLAARSKGPKTQQELPLRASRKATRPELWTTRLLLLTADSRVQGSALAAKRPERPRLVLPKLPKPVQSARRSDCLHHDLWSTKLVIQSVR